MAERYIWVPDFEVEPINGFDVDYLIKLLRFKQRMMLKRIIREKLCDVVVVRLKGDDQPCAFVVSHIREDNVEIVWIWCDETCEYGDYIRKQAQSLHHSRAPAQPHGR